MLGLIRCRSWLNTAHANQGLKKLIMVMHWAVKYFRKEKLQHARSISISVDDRKEYRLLRYRCSLQPSAHQSAGSAGDRSPGPQVPVAHGFRALEEWCSDCPTLATEGLLGVHRIGGSVREQQLEIHDEDKAQVMTSSVLDLLIEACRDPEGKVDSEALQHLQAHVRLCI